MIYDGMSALPLYRGLTRGLDVAIDWVQSCDLASLEAGRVEIDGSRVFALVQEPTTKLVQDAHFEVHRRYLDLQFDLEGVEDVKVTFGDVVPCGDFDEAADKGYCDAAYAGDGRVTCVSLAGGRFAVFMVGEPHMPTLAPQGESPSRLRKVCVKILADEFWDGDAAI